MKNIAVFVSGSGTDLQSLIDAVNAKKIKARIRVVVSDKDGIFALERAKKEKIETAVFKVSDYTNKEERDRAIIKYLSDKDISLIVLAGYLSILTKPLIDKYMNKIINIHPSLIPKYSGMGFYGDKVHKAVLENNEKETGATVHYVDYGTDTGKIIRQEKVKVYKTDTVETLKKRVLDLEHKLLPKVVGKLIDEMEE